MGYSPKPNVLRILIAPLFVLSMGLHAVLLAVPLPSRPEPAAEPEASESTETEAAVVDLLSISSLATAEPELPPPSAAPEAPPEPAPQPAAVQAPVQPAVPETFPEGPLPPDLPPEELPPEDLAQDEFAALESEPTNPGFDPNRQAQLVRGVAGSLGRAPGQSNFDLTDQFPGDIWDLYVSQWNPTKHQCFFSAIDRSGYTLAPGVGDLRYLSRNIREIERTDIPRTFPGQTINALGPIYCDELFFEVVDNGTPIVWLSLVPVSPGGSTALVIIWQQDPRTG